MAGLAHLKSRLDLGPKRQLEDASALAEVISDNDVWEINDVLLWDVWSADALHAGGLPEWRAVFAIRGQEVDDQLTARVYAWHMQPYVIAITTPPPPPPPLPNAQNSRMLRC